jgi:hypothetical protein
VNLESNAVDAEPSAGSMPKLPVVQNHRPIAIPIDSITNLLPGIYSPIETSEHSYV